MFAALLSLAFLGCAVPEASVETPEEFVELYIEAACAAGVECGRYASVEACHDQLDNWRSFCTTESLPRWSPEEAAICINEDVAAYVCDDDPESYCSRICVDE